MMARMNRLTTKAISNQSASHVAPIRCAGEGTVNETDSTYILRFSSVATPLPLDELLSWNGTSNAGRKDMRHSQPGGCDQQR